MYGLESFNKISEASEIKVESKGEFNQATLDKFDKLFEGDGVEIHETNNDIESQLNIDSANEKFDKMFEGDDIEDRKLAEKEKSQKIQDFVNGKIEFEEVKEIFTEDFAKLVNSNKPWSWNEDIPFGDELTAIQKKAIKEYAVEKKMIPDIPIKEQPNGIKYADFSKVKVYECKLNQEDWKISDHKQFAKSNEMLKQSIEKNPQLASKFTKEQLEEINCGETPSGYTWHHFEKDGIMQLVPYGIHNITYHNGGRSPGNWADGQR